MDGHSRSSRRTCRKQPVVNFSATNLGTRNSFFVRHPEFLIKSYLPQLDPKVVPISPHLILENVTDVSGMVFRMFFGSPSVALHGPLLPPSNHVMNPFG